MKPKLPALAYFDERYIVITSSIDWQGNTIYLSYNTPIMDDSEAAYATFIPLNEIQEKFANLLVPDEFTK